MTAWPCLPAFGPSVQVDLARGTWTLIDPRGRPSAPREYSGDGPLLLALASEGWELASGWRLGARYPAKTARLKETAG